MSSTVPTPAFFLSDPMFGDQFPSFENGGFTPWDCSELLASEAQDHDDHNNTQLSPKPVGSGSSSGSDEPSEPNRSDQTSTVSVIDERKRRRMISNRESARRSRMRKQKHLENLRNQVNRLRIENRELTNRLRFVLYHCQSVRRDNDRLRSEHSMLRQKLSNIRQILMFRQLQQFTSAWPCNNLITTEQNPSLITS
ncbi:hypothetical protein JCGZ_12566 [Jatropha curcas]|uniref:BZIP domain-containing protein n=1 Tax=Jatropha curcas TaxID=180498 RepID=A0A067KIL3_JATCU|nr:basic leucine zipper 4 [Jatropha curcas]KDP32105.1 hypothetical protein JCGZ_12566 [Jatropha curcas]